MRSTRLFLLLTAILAVSVGAWPAGQAGQTAPPPPLPPPIPTGTGFISGQVIDSVSRKPIPEAIVRISGRFIPAGGRAATGQGTGQVMTDAQGRFFFGSLPAGTVTVTADKTGYGPVGGSTELSVLQLTLADNDKMLDARIRLSKLAALSGMLRDAAGDPIVGTDVLVMSQNVVNGQLAWQPRGRARSDDRGIYRLGNLPAGDYITCACSRDPIPLDPILLTTLGSEPLQMMNVAARALSGGSDAITMDANTRTYAPTFHANTSSITRATKVTIAPGEDKTGVDINLEVVRGTRVSGAVVGAPGPISATSLRLVPAGDGGVTPDMFSVPPMLVQPDGRFDFAPVPPGQYRLVVVYRDTGGRGGGPSGAALSLVGGAGRGAPAAPAEATMSARGGAPNEAPPLWASELLTVPEAGLRNVTVALRRASVLTGRMQWLGAAPQPPATMLQRAVVGVGPFNVQDVLTSMAATSAGRFAPDATFTVAGVVPGRYVLSPNALPGYPNLKSIVAGGQDITDMPLDVADKDVGEIVITFIDTPLAALTVTTNAATTSPPFDDAWLFVFPADREYWPNVASARRRYRAAPFSPKGNVALDGLPEGDYFVVVSTGSDFQNWQDPAHLEALSRKAQRVTLVDGDKRAVEVRR